ncbi:hypothetical protein EGT74_00250 [Chitinophaga lutea]|uniref:Glycosyl-hydrolase family 116 catalytic region domain-containing protein n=1 Tax=Chitinophaga lutea TaxID=2488634 RepID=A0A3N4QEA0_9BACT|nr:GH116 family glycosyl hydrolase [Chitinophaga lutea]RPE14280.1 hypothetical protein EGT74_00250 [Chitinophaga lutea]
MEKKQEHPRREFLKIAGLFTAGLAVARIPVWARGVAFEEYPLHNIPADKGIDTAWLKSLYERGTATAYLKSRNELQFLGMPVGGLHAGTVYVGGDGRLWLWQVYNETIESTHEGIDPKTVNWHDGTKLRKIRVRDGAAYVEPAMADNKRVLEQGFAVKVEQEGKTWVRELREDHWDEIRFEAAYPMAVITYTGKNAPVEVRLKVYSPFVPLNADDSSLPATILRAEIKNISGRPMQASLVGWMENGVNKITAKAGSGKKQSKVISADTFTSIHFGYNTSDAELLTAKDAGSMSISLMGKAATTHASFNPWPVTAESFGNNTAAAAEADGDDKLVGALAVSQQMAPGDTMEADYFITWHFNNPHPGLKKLVKDADGGFEYAVRFKDAAATAAYLAAHFKRLTTLTERWQQTWNDSTLPHWFLERTFVNIGTLATANTYRFASGRFWGWEGVGACAGTCTHVWQYGHTAARIFPSIERDQRQRVDLGVAFKEDSGAIIFRAENENRPAIDGQAGTILRIYREHQMSKDDAFLRANWPKIKKAVQFMLAQDKNGDGMTDSPMENTLDAVWEGEIAWIVGLCIAAARAAQSMAEETGDTTFAKTCAAYVQKGKANMEKELFNGEYFIHRPDAVQGRKKLGSYNTCHIDQVYGQSWAFQVGLPRVLDRDKSLSALKALWKYNFTMDVGPYIKTHTGGRPYALEGEGGMIMNTNPRNEPKPYGEDVTWQLGYFHECMSGFEHQVAAHMMAEGMADEALVLTRVIHDRYHGAKRNPYNEIECSDHYARAMASYGTFISACGFEYHGPKKYIGFAPRVSPENFKAAFTAAEGWGTYSQQAGAAGQQHELKVVFGNLPVGRLMFELVQEWKPGKVTVRVNGAAVPAQFKTEGKRVLIRLKNTVMVEENGTLQIGIA